MHTNIGECPECRSGRWGYYSLAEGGGWASAPRQHMGLWTHGVLGSYAKRCRTALGRAGAGQHGDDGDEIVAPKPVVTLVMVTKSLRSRRA